MRISSNALDGNAAVTGPLYTVWHTKEVASTVSQTAPMFQNILVPLDGSTASNSILPHAAEIASKFGGRLLLLHVIPDLPSIMAATDGVAYVGNLSDEYRILEQEGHDLLAAAKAQVESEYQGLNIQLIQATLQGHTIAEIIASVAKERQADLMVMTTHGRSGIAHMMMGSVAQAALKKLNIPVLLLRPSK